MEPGPLDFSDSATTEKLQKLFIERQGREAFKVLQEEVKPSAADDEGEADEEEPVRDKEKERAAVAQRIFEELVQKAQIKHGALERLAHERAQSFEMLITGPEGLPAERVEVRTSKETDETEKSPSCVFGLEPFEQMRICGGHF